MIFYVGLEVEGSNIVVTMPQLKRRYHKMVFKLMGAVIGFTAVRLERDVALSEHFATSTLVTENI